MPIKEVYLGLYDGVHGTPKPADEGPVFLGIKNLTDDGRLDLSEIRHIAEEDFPRWTKRVLPRGGDLVFTYEATLNRYAVIPEGFRGCLGRRLALIRPNPDKVDTKFLYYYFFGKEWRDTVATKTLSGATVDRIPIITFPEFPISLPPLPTQRKIAAVLSAYDDLIENNTRRIKLLEQMAQALYREWFVRPCQSGKLPKGWEEKPIGEVIETLGGGTPSTKTPEFWDGGDVIWFTPSDLTAAGTMFIADSGKKITRAGLDGSSARIFPAYSVMMTSRATIGVVAINTKEACTNQGFIICIPNDRVSAYQLYFWVEENTEKIISIASGATYKEISRSEFRELPIAVPTVDVAKRFVDMVQPVCKLIENLQAKNANLRRTHDLLLPKLISGELPLNV